MKNLHFNLKTLFAILFLIMFLPSCNNEEIFVVEQAAIVEETTVNGTEDEVTPNTEDQQPTTPVEAVDDAFTTTENVSVELVLHTNDKNLPTVGIISNTNPANGSLEVNNNNTADNPLDDIITYSPNPGFSGSDSFEYTICDTATPQNCSTAIVTITVEPKIDDIATELKAAPGIFGAGAYTSGGRGGKVLHVTSLLDSYTPGTLRYALMQSYPRIIVFDVSGTIDISGTIQVGGSSKRNVYDNVTVLGQTAPEGGITITGGRIWFEYTENIIVRYLKFRNGHSSNNGDCLTIARCSNVVVDHCSFSYGLDEALDVAGAVNGTDGNITLSNNLFGECKTAMIVGADSTGEYGGVSVLRNATANVGWRFPKAGGAVELDVINNVHHNWENRTIRMDAENYSVNQINNYYQDGNSSDNTKFAKAWTTDPDMNPRIYTSGNFISPNIKPDGFDSNNALGWDKFGGFPGGSTEDMKPEWFKNSPLPIQGAPLPILPASDIKSSVLSDVGACRYLNADGTIGFYRDSLDSGYIDLIQTNSNQGYIDQANYGEEAVNMPTSTRPADYDSDQDGMPDVWEQRFFGDLSQNSDGDHDGDGYTNIEEFTNLIDK